MLATNAFNVLFTKRSEMLVRTLILIHELLQHIGHGSFARHHCGTATKTIFAYVLLGAPAAGRIVTSSNTRPQARTLSWVRIDLPVGLPTTHYWRRWWECGIRCLQRVRSARCAAAEWWSWSDGTVCMRNAMMID
jgi:hypothetical protein